MSETLALPSSTLHLPVEVNLTDLEPLINKQLQGVLYRDDDMDDGDNMMMLVEKKGNITIQINGWEVEYSIPLHVWIKKGIKITSVEAEGDLILSFKTVLDIQSDWTAKSQSVLVGHDWIEKPKIKLVGVGLPVKMIADTILQRGAPKISERIDYNITKHFNLRAYIRRAWQVLRKPVALPGPYPAWLRVYPEAMQMAPLKSESPVIKSKLSLKGRIDVSLGDQPEELEMPPIPEFSIKDSEEEDVKLFVEVHAQYKVLEQLAEDFVKDQTFEQAGKVVTVSDIKIRGNEHPQLFVDAHLDGAVSGTVSIAAEPALNTNIQMLNFQNIDVDIESSNFLFRGIANLFKGVIVKQIKEKMQIDLQQRIRPVMQTVRDRLNEKPIAPGLQLHSDVDDITVVGFDPSADKILVRIIANGRLEVLLDVSELLEKTAIKDKKE